MTLTFIENPSFEELQKIQDQLSFEKGLGIEDIWCSLNPYYLLAEKSGKNVGVLSISVGEEFAEIYKLYVPKEHRRKGVGRALFDHAVTVLRLRGIKKIGIEAVGDSHYFWDKIISIYQNKMFPEQRKFIIDI